MNQAHTAITVALSSLLLLGAAGTAQAGERKDVEKCYGVAKTGKNDCKTLSNACAGHSMEDGQKDAFIALPKGSCERIIGGSLEAPRADAK